MSIIVIRDNLIAADCGGLSNGNVKAGMRKLIQRGHLAIGWAGNFLDGKIFTDWYFAGADPNALPKFHNRAAPNSAADFAALVLKADGWEYWTEWMVPETDGDNLLPYYAIGSGSQAAMAAMQMGADAERAVEVACAVVNGCDLPVVAFRVE